MENSGAQEGNRAGRAATGPPGERETVLEFLAFLAAEGITLCEGGPGTIEGGLDFRPTELADVQLAGKFVRSREGGRDGAAATN